MILELCIGFGIIAGASYAGNRLDKTNQLYRAAVARDAALPVDIFRSRAVVDLEWQYARDEISMEQFEERLDKIVRGQPIKVNKPVGVLQINHAPPWRQKIKREIIAAYNVPPHQMTVLGEGSRREYVLGIVTPRKQDFEVDRPPVNLADNIFKARSQGLITNNEARELMHELTHRRNYGPFAAEIFSCGDTDTIIK